MSGSGAGCPTSFVTPSTSTLAPVAVLKAVIVLAIVGALIFLVLRLTLGPVRRAVSARRAHFVFEDDHRDSRAMRAAADAAAAAGDWALAVLERFRAVVRSLEERDLLEDRPAVTADEAARATGLRFPDLALAMAKAADTFDGVRYGHDTVGPVDDAALRDLDATLARRSILDTATP